MKKVSRRDSDKKKHKESNLQLQNFEEKYKDRDCNIQVVFSSSKT